MNEVESGNIFPKLLQKEEFEKMINRKAENGEISASFCCVYFIIKKFQNYFLQNGFDEGFEVLRFVANKINNTFPVDMVSKIDDGEFAAITDIEEVEVFIGRARKDFDEVYVHTGMELLAGIYPITADDKDARTIITNARIACTKALKSLEGIAVFNKEQVDSKVLMQHYVMHHLESAIENGEIVVYYQPIFHTLSGKVCGFEALTRWNNPEYGILMPNDFVPVLEHSRKIYMLDVFVIKQVCKDEYDVLKMGLEAVPISINLTRLDFSLVDMFEIVEEEITKYDLPRKLIQIEISEAEIVSDREQMMKELKRFHEKGYKITFDDFGSEYSALHALKDIPFDTIKINSSFLSGFSSDLRSRIMMKNVLNMSKELGITTMMGSVENEEILEFLKQTGCEKSQGHLYSEAHPLADYGVGAFPFEFESEDDRKFYEQIGVVNILSQTPIDTQFSYLENESTYLNQLPLALLELSNNEIHFLMHSKGFEEMFSALMVEGVAFERVFTSNRTAFSKQFKALAEQCLTDTEIHQMESVIGDGYARIMLRRVSLDRKSGKIGIMATAERMTDNDPGVRSYKLNSSLRFLYMIYNSVNIVDVDENSYETVYMNTSSYSNSMVEGSFSDAIREFANSAIYNEDREKFIAFYNLDTLEERLSEYEIDHLTDYFRTKDNNGTYDWLMYVIVPIMSDRRNKFLMCSRRIDSERMRKLPEISQSGSEFYDMPSDPIFLLLASDAFTETLGYGSFEQFIRNTFYLEASLSDDQTIYMHLGQAGLISDFGETGYISLPFGEVTKGMIFAQVVEEDREKMYEFYNRDRLLSEYEKGKISGSMIYLEQTGANETPRYQNACYHIRKSRDDEKIHIYILKYDIDDFKRTNEKIRNLAERDTLTGLYNRMTIGRIVDEFMSDEETESLSLVLLDLDYFKQINDRYGHDCGDCVLKDASDRMKKFMGENSYPARIGGDEFQVIIRNRNVDDIDKTLREFSTMEKTVTYNGQTIAYTMSVGYAVYPNDAATYNELYQNADQALYIVKMNGKNGYGKYEKGQEVAERTELGFNPATISDAIPGGFLVYKAGENEEILFANKQMIEMYECIDFEDFKSFTGDSFKGCVHPDDYALVEDVIDREIDDNNRFDYLQFRAVTKTGKTKIMEDYGRLKHSSNDGDLFYVFLIDYERKNKLYHDIIEEIHKHWNIK